jgi:phosphoglycerate dehydrogenase-like enzyme
MSQRELVIQTEDLDAEAAAWLGERCELIVQQADGSARWLDLLSRASALVVRTYTRVDGAMLARAPALRVVGRAGVGLDNIDVPACRARGVEVVHTPGANTRAVVEYVTALMLDALRPRLFIDRALAAEEWNRLRRELVADRELGELTLGVWGFGRVGSGVAGVGSALGMRVLANDLREVPEASRGGATMVDAATLLRESDVLSVHVDERAANRGLVNDAAFRAMKPSVLLINTSRGFIVDARACASFMRSNPDAQALLDVHEPEPFDAAYPLLGIPNVQLAPHLASGTRAAKARMSWVVRDVWRVLTGEKPEFPAPRA